MYSIYIIIGVITVFSILLIITVAVILEDKKERKRQQLRLIKDIGMNEVKEITKEEAILLIQDKFPKNRQYLEILTLNLGNHFFLYNTSLEGGLERSCGIKSNSLLIAKDFSLEEKLKDIYLNYSSRILIFKENLRREHSESIVRRVWAVGPLKGNEGTEKELLLNIFERDEFKTFLELNLKYVKTPCEAGSDYLQQLELSNAFGYKNIFVVMQKDLLDKKGRQTLAIFEASDCYQVATKIENII